MKIEIHGFEKNVEPRKLAKFMRDEDAACFIISLEYSKVLLRNGAKVIHSMSAEDNQYLIYPKFMYMDKMVYIDESMDNPFEIYCVDKEFICRYGIAYAAFAKMEGWYNLGGPSCLSRELINKYGIHVKRQSIKDREDMMRHWSFSPDQLNEMETNSMIKEAMRALYIKEIDTARNKPSDDETDAFNEDNYSLTKLKINFHAKH